MEVEETVEATEEAVEQVEEQEEATTSEETEETSDDTAAESEETEEEEKPKQSKGVQKRIDELVRQREDERRRAERLEQRLHEMYTKQQPQQEQQPVEQPDPKPTLEAFDYDDVEYQEALVDWKVRQQLKVQQQQMQQQQQQIAQQQKMAEFQRKTDEIYAKGQEKHEDFRTYVDHAAQTGLFTRDMVFALAESEIGDDLAYHLATNPEEAKRISGLSPYGQAREIGRLEIKLQTPAPAKTTTAPPPPKSMTGKVPAAIDPDKLSMDEWLKGRQEGKW